MPIRLKASNILSMTPIGYVFTFVQRDGRPSQFNYAAYIRTRRRYVVSDEQTKFARAERAFIEVQARVDNHRADVKRIQSELKKKEFLLRQAEDLLLAEAELLQRAALHLTELFHPKPLELKDGRRYGVTVVDNKLELRGRMVLSKRKKKVT